MISERGPKKFCSEPIENIENYDKAVADTENVWDCHHRAEILPCGRYTMAQLQKHRMYWYRPASELIFLRHDVHTSLHHKGKILSEKTKHQMIESLRAESKLKKMVEMTRLSDGFTMTFPSQHEAVRYLRENGFPKADNGNISRCCHGTKHFVYGAKWRFVDD